MLLYAKQNEILPSNCTANIEVTYANKKLEVSFYFIFHMDIMLSSGYPFFKHLWLSFSPSDSSLPCSLPSSRRRNSTLPQVSCWQSSQASWKPRPSQTPAGHSWWSSGPSPWFLRWPCSPRTPSINISMKKKLWINFSISIVISIHRYVVVHTFSWSSSTANSSIPHWSSLSFDSTIALYNLSKELVKKCAMNKQKKGGK